VDDERAADRKHQLVDEPGQEGANPHDPRLNVQRQEGSAKDDTGHESSRGVTDRAPAISSSDPTKRKPQATVFDTLDRRYQDRRGKPARFDQLEVPHHAFPEP